MRDNYPDTEPYQFKQDKQKGNSQFSTLGTEGPVPRESCGHQLTESEFEFYENRHHLDRLCKRCVMEQKAR